MLNAKTGITKYLHKSRARAKALKKYNILYNKGEIIMKKTFIKIMENYGSKYHNCGIVEAGEIFTLNEFIEKFGTNMADAIDDSFLDYSEKERAKGVEFWQNGMHVFMWEE